MVQNILLNIQNTLSTIYQITTTKTYLYKNIYIVEGMWKLLTSIDNPITLNAQSTSLNKHQLLKSLNDKPIKHKYFKICRESISNTYVILIRPDTWEICIRYLKWSRIFNYYFRTRVSPSIYVDGTHANGIFWVGF